MNYKFFRGLILFIAGVAGFLILVVMILAAPALVAFGACCSG